MELERETKLGVIVKVANIGTKRNHSGTKVWPPISLLINFLMEPHVYYPSFSQELNLQE